MSAVKAPRATEAQAQATIVAAARLAGWRVHAERPAQMRSGRWATAVQGDPGWPDLVLVRGDRCLMVELKRRPNRVEPEQRLWHTALRDAGVSVGIVWVPEGLDAFLSYLTGHAELTLEVPT